MGSKHSHHRKNKPKQINMSGFLVPDSRYVPPKPPVGGDDLSDDYDSDLDTRYNKARHQHKSKPTPLNLGTRGYGVSPGSIRSGFQHSASSSRRAYRGSPVPSEDEGGGEEVGTPVSVSENENNEGQEEQEEEEEEEFIEPEPEPPRRRRKRSSIKPPRKRKRDMLKRATFWQFVASLGFGLLAAYYISGATEAVGTESVGEPWEPNPMLEVADFVESSVANGPHVIVLSGFFDVEPYGVFQKHVKEYCRHVRVASDKAGAKAHKIFEAERKEREKKERREGKSVVGSASEKNRPEKKEEEEEQQKKKNKNKKSWWWTAYLGETVNDAFDQMYPGPETKPMSSWPKPPRAVEFACDELVNLLRNLKRESKYSPEVYLAHGALHAWVLEAQSVVDSMYMILDKHFLKRATWTGERRPSVPRPIEPDEQYEYGGGVEGDHYKRATLEGGGGVGEGKGSEIRAKLPPVIAVNASNGGREILSTTADSFGRYRDFVRKQFKRMIEAEQVLDRMVEVGTELLNDHDPEYWLGWVKGPDGEYEYHKDLKLTFKNVPGVDRWDVDKIQSSRELAQKALSNITTHVVSDFKWAIAEVGNELRDGGPLDKVHEWLSPMGQPDMKAWERKEMVQGRLVAKWKYLEVSEVMVWDMKDRSDRLTRLYETFYNDIKKLGRFKSLTQKVDVLVKEHREREKNKRPFEERLVMRKGRLEYYPKD